MAETAIILGGDGFCGWPTSLGFSSADYDVCIVDNLSRRKIDVDLECESLTPIRPISKRIATWKELTGRSIRFEHMDVAVQYNKLLNLIRDLKPSTIIHFAEQRAAPYSMKNSMCKRYTVDNNINATHNVLCAMVESGVDAHLIHLGTMGVYGYGTAGIPIPEGYLQTYVESEQGPLPMEILYPANPGSVYHMTKTQDALMFYFYNKNDKLRITDLHQGVVWGTNTPDTLQHEDLINRFDYDGDYGTVLNRFLMQAVVGHPLTVYGCGGQTRAFIHIRDTVQCILLAARSAPRPGERVQIFNQATETHTVRELAELVARLAKAEVRYYANPRREDLHNSLLVKNDKFLSLGLRPTTLSNGLLQEVMEIAGKYRERCDMSRIICNSMWSQDQHVDREGAARPQEC